MNIFQQIFTDHYEYIQYIIKPRPIVMENIDKMIHCGDFSYGGAMYGCEKCGKLKFVPFRCKCRLCPSCGTKYSIDRTNAMAFKLIKVQHRHCVFTIDSQLRSFFLKDRTLLNLLFDAVRSTFLRLFHNMNKSESFTPGFICVLHTFGRDLKWNPHIHCLISEGGLGNSGSWRKVSHFNYKFLRNAFRTVLLKLMLDKLGPSFKPVISKCYHNHKEGFYVYAKPNKCNPNEIIKYIGRYLGRPVIATSRIDKYDGEFVTFHYNRHEDDKLVSETIPAVDFIKRVIGLPGETVRVDTDGNIYINDTLLSENYGAEVILDPGRAIDGVKLGPDEYFVMGDNRNHSMDSRDITVGSIKKSEFLGKAFIRIYPFSAFGGVD